VPERERAGVGVSPAGP